MNNRFRYFCLLAGLIFTALFLPRLEINSSPDSYVPDTIQAKIIDKKVRKWFPDDETLVLLFQGDNLFSKLFLQSLNELTQEIENLPIVDKVLAITEQEKIKASQEGFEIRDLVDFNEELPQPEIIRSEVTQDRFARNMIISENGNALAVVVRLVSDHGTLVKVDLKENITQMISSHGLTKWMAGWSGPVALEVGEFVATQKANQKFVPLTTLVGLLLIGFLFGQVKPTLLSGFIIAINVMFSVSLYGALSLPFNAIAGITPPMISAMTSAMIIHLLNAFRSLERRGIKGEEVVLRGTSEVFKPALLTVITTVFGLLSLCLSEVPPVRHFGLIGSVGLVWSFLVCMVFMRPLWKLTWNPHLNRKTLFTLFDKLPVFLAKISVRYAGWVAAFFLTVVVGLLFTVPHVVIETNVLNFFKDGHPIRVANEKMEKEISGTMPLSLFFEASEIDQLKSAHFLNKVKELQVWLQARSEVDKAISPVDFIEEMNWAFHGEDSSFRTIPAEDKLIAQYLFLYDSDEIYEFYDRDFRRALLYMNLNIHSANSISHFTDEVLAKVKEIDFSPVKVEATGHARLFSEHEDLLIRGQLRSLFGAAVLILLCLVWICRKPGLVWAAFVPNLTPVLSMFGAMVLLGFWLDFATVMIASIIIGVAVDDSIHLIFSYMKRMQEGKGNHVSAVLKSYNMAGRAVTATTLVLCAQFLVLTASEFVPFEQFGLLISIGLVSAWLYDLMLLPSLLTLRYCRYNVPFRK